MATEKTAEERFAAIYPSIYPTIKAQEKFTEEDWKVGLDTEATLQEETLTELQKEFFTALRAKTVETMQSLIERETVRDNFKLSDLLNTIDYWQITNLFHPAQPHFSTKLREVIWNLIISYSENNNFAELLRWAIVSYQSDDVIQRFIERIDNPDSADLQGLTFLHLACFFNQEWTVESLLAEKANPQIEDKNGNLPLHYACANNHPGIVRLLLNSMTDKSCIAELLREGAIYSAEIKQFLLDATHPQLSEPPLSKIAGFIATHGLNKQKLVLRTNGHAIELTRLSSTEWEINLAVTKPN